MKRGALVLAGGRSTRMGRDKATLPFGPETLLQRVVRRLGASVEEIVVVARPGQDLPPLPPDVRIARDSVLDRGPLGGLSAGLAATTAEIVFATACDVPFLVPAFVDLLVQRLGTNDVAVAEAEERLHPLAAVYRVTVRPHIEALLAAERLRPVFLYERVPTVRVSEADLRRVDPDLATLANLNTPEAYDAALARLAAEAPPRPRVRIELFEGARRRAGIASFEVEAATLGEALLAAERQCPALAPDIVHAGRLAPHWRASIGGRRFVEDPATLLTDGDAVLLLSALAGG